MAQTDTQVGGSSFDDLVASMLRDRYAAQLSAGAAGAGVDSGRVEDLLAGARARATLLREGKRVKEVLSASTTAYVTLEGLPLLAAAANEDEQTDSAAAGSAAMVDGVLRTNITRSEFEEAAEGLLARSVAPVETVVRRWIGQQQRLGTQPGRMIESVQLVGGGSRVPVLQAAILRVLQRLQPHQQQPLTLGAELNADEAMAHGAALLAVAKHSPLALHDTAVGRNPSRRPPSITFAAGGPLSPPPPSDAPACVAMEAAALAESRQTVQRLRSGAADVAEAGAVMYELEAFILAELELASLDGDGDGSEGSSSTGEQEEMAAWRAMLLAEEEWVWDNGNSTAVALRARMAALLAKAPASRQPQLRAERELAAMRNREVETDAKRRQKAQRAEPSGQRTTRAPRETETETETGTERGASRKNRRARLCQKRKS